MHVEWTDGRKASFHALWLADNCPSQFDAGTQQRVGDTYAIPPDVVPLKIELEDRTALRVVWQHGAPDSVFDAYWLRSHCFELQSHRRALPRLWGSELHSYFPEHGLPAFQYEHFLKQGDIAYDQWLGACEVAVGGRLPHPVLAARTRCDHVLTVPPLAPATQFLCVTTA